GETQVKITDFGAALIASGDTTQILSIGSPAYMSPEQVKEAELDHRTDIYSTGVVMYHLLTGRLPFTGANNFSLVYQITHSHPAQHARPGRAVRRNGVPLEEGQAPRRRCHGERRSRHHLYSDGQARARLRRLPAQL